VGSGDGTEQGGGQPACANGEAECDACGRARSAGEVILAELDQDGERDTYRNAGRKCRGKGDTSARTRTQRDQGGDGRGVARQDRSGESEAIGDPAAEESAGDAPDEEARQRHPGHGAARVQVSDPVELDERARPEEVHRARHLDGNQQQERSPPVGAADPGCLPRWRSALLVAQQHEPGQYRGRNEQRGGAQTHRVQCGRREDRSQEEPDIAAGGEDAHRHRAVPCCAPRRLPGRGMKHRYA
jgi:hypothetical protein